MKSRRATDRERSTKWNCETKNLPTGDRNLTMRRWKPAENPNEVARAGVPENFHGDELEGSRYRAWTSRSVSPAEYLYGDVHSSTTRGPGGPGTHFFGKCSEQEKAGKKDLNGAIQGGSR